MVERISSTRRYGRAIALLGVFVLLTGCQSFNQVKSSLPMPVATHEFAFDPERDAVVGTLQIVAAREEDTFSDLARRFNVGYEDMVSANPGVDPWVPHAGTEIVIPTQFVLPDAPRTGIVVNLAAMRMFYFPPAQPGEPRKVITHPLGIGRVEWKTPEGATKIASKTASPTWIPTPSIRKEHAENGDPLPAKVPPGPDNPLGTHVLKLGWQNYSIHGTDKPPSIGLRGSHGCLRMYPEDIVRMFNDVPVGTPVRVVNQPTVFGWRGNALYVQTYPVLEEDKRDQAALRKKALSAALESAQAQHDLRAQLTVNHAVLDAVAQNPRAIAIPVTQAGLTVPTYLARSMRVDNRRPVGATWQQDMGQGAGQDTGLELTQRNGDTAQPLKPPLRP
ncbi:MAG: L,D-transpeptidase family protein [Gammaproteobacteria bacterium]|nr:L,D-transpeptidase family protein [Gammaproteobacteria bacterium]